MGAPFLMQQLCLEYVLTVARVQAAVEPARDLAEPESWDVFYRAVADRYVPGVFAALTKGKNSRGTERIPRVLKNGRSTDIYGAILYTLSQMGPRRSVTTQRLAQEMEKHFIEVPKTNQLTSTLQYMDDIAVEKRGEGDPAVDLKDGEFHILDPFLSFYLRHGTWELPAPPRMED